ncbi:hypothetical protein DRE_01767 [Drechslerella stenobrocha 248]|uniref:Uncharacterized protein n=1 Tax=Drechslerella stenobrocha 248 TaxID=1043628 RepID=W7IH41_9PEZI|nr:hypothetical protein DRE_01767 [Drechslerella stenobrocha 248]
MAYGAPSDLGFDSYEPPDAMDIDVLEHFELPTAYTEVHHRPATDTSSPASKYSLAVSHSVKDVPPAVSAYVRSLGSKHATEIFEAFQALHMKNMTQYLTSADFSNTMKAAKPKYMFPISWMARQITPGTAPQSNPYDGVYKTFWEGMNLVFTTMLKHGHQPTVLDYTNLMSKAMWSRSPRLLSRFWFRMTQSGVRPNTWTYNVRLAMTARPRPKNNLHKFPLVHSEKHIGFWQGREKNPLVRAMAVYADMLKNGLFPNSMTVELLAIAHAAVGDVGGITRLIQNVYGLTIGGENNNPAENANRIITPGSPIYPTSKTLKVLAVAYCRNSQFAAALQAVDAISNVYNVPIKDDTWDVLLTYSYALARPKYNLLPASTTARLAEMRNESLQARDILIRSLTRSHDPEELEAAEQEIRRAVGYYQTHVLQRYRLMKARWESGELATVTQRWRGEMEMNERLYHAFMWKEAMGYWLYALLRAHWDEMKRQNTPIVEFETRQMNLLEEFGAYFERPKVAGQKTAVPERVGYRYRYPSGMVGLKGFPAM